MKKLAITTIVAALLATACSSVDCKLESKVMCKIAMQDAEGSEVALNYPLTVTLNRTAVDGDTVYLNHSSSVSSLSLPMSYNGDVDKITLSLMLPDSSYVTDIVTVAKTNEPTFESVDCAPRYWHELTSVSSTHNFIDTLIINNAKVTNDASVTNIYLRVRN